MKFIYNCFGGSHSSVTAAALHIGLLPDLKTAFKHELLKVPYYDAQVAIDHGRIRFMGFDEKGNEVYISSKKNLRASYGVIMRQILYFFEEENEDEEVIFIDTMPYVNLWMMIGGYLSRRLRIRFLGRPIILYGTQLSYLKFVHLVQGIKERYLLPRENL